ncbi:MAG: potassium channel family protein [Oscillospiraceae bacterium]|nr:potassium channel family protein [Oscillospiraceae bacterium]
MRRLQILRRVLRETGAYSIWSGFLIQFFISAAVIWLREPEIHRYGDALWYCYAVVTTIGFGDVVAQHFLSRLLSVLLSISAALVIALVTGVVVNYFNQITALRQKDSLMALMDKLERLPELPREELEQIALRAKQFSNQK